MTDRTILLVDDDDKLLAGLIRALHEQPFHICTAPNGQEAIRLLETRDIDVIVADERMPGMSGMQLLTWVAEHRPDVVRIILTAYAETETAIRAINNAGVFRFFRKPINEARLAIAIREAIDRKAMIEAGGNGEAQQRQLLQLQQAGEDVKFRTRIAAEDLRRPIERILECCRRLEEQASNDMNADSQHFLAEARKAAAEARRLVLQLEAAVAARKES